MDKKNYKSCVHIFKSNGKQIIVSVSEFYNFHHVSTDGRLHYFAEIGNLFIRKDMYFDGKYKKNQQGT